MRALFKLSEFQGEVATKGIDLNASDEQKRIFAVKKSGCFYVYRNSCPHTGAPLNWQQDEFLSHDKRYIQCSLHGAMFRIEDGVCIAGPCPGSALTALAVQVSGDDLLVDI